MAYMQYFSTNKEVTGDLYFMPPDPLQKLNRYVQIEKETCEKFADFLIGQHKFMTETDQKPLLALLKTKRLDELTPRIQRFRMHLMRFSYEITHTAQKKKLMTADTLSS